MRRARPGPRVRSPGVASSQARGRRRRRPGAEFLDDTSAGLDRDFAARRTPDGAQDAARWSRFIQLEGRLSLTGANADTRIRVRDSADCGCRLRTRSRTRRRPQSRTAGGQCGRGACALAFAAMRRRHTGGHRCGRAQERGAELAAAAGQCRGDCYGSASTQRRAWRSRQPRCCST